MADQTSNGQREVEVDQADASSSQTTARSVLQVDIPRGSQVTVRNARRHGLRSLGRVDDSVLHDWPTMR